MVSRLKRYWPLYLKLLIPSRQLWAAPAKSCATTSGCSSFETASACPAVPVNLTFLSFTIGSLSRLIRRQELLSLAQTLLPITNAAQLILDHLRAQTIISDAVAEHGTMQIPTSGSPYQLARIWMPQESQCIPDMSANRHTLWLRFSTPDAKHRLHAVHETLSFRLGLCI